MANQILPTIPQPGDIDELKGLRSACMKMRRMCLGNGDHAEWQDRENERTGDLVTDIRKICKRHAAGPSGVGYRAIIDLLDDIDSVPDFEEDAA